MKNLIISAALALSSLVVPVAAHADGRDGFGRGRAQPVYVQPVQAPQHALRYAPPVYVPQHQPRYAPPYVQPTGYEHRDERGDRGRDERGDRGDRGNGARSVAAGSGRVAVTAGVGNFHRGLGADRASARPTDRAACTMVVRCPPSTLPEDGSRTA
ncbi:MAG: hypothetical protein WCJ30_25930, partial [Deltaproteobacteria bacterium]